MTDRLLANRGSVRRPSTNASVIVRKKLDAILAAAKAVRDRRRNKLGGRNGLCGAIRDVVQSTENAYNCWEDVSSVVRYSMLQLFSLRFGYLPDPGVWTRKRAKLLAAIIASLEDKRTRAKIRDYISAAPWRDYVIQCHPPGK
jgi:hypothetical protein